MKLVFLVVAGVLATGAASLTATVITRHGVGPAEYVASVALVAALLVTAARLARSALRPS